MKRQQQCTDERVWDRGNTAAGSHSHWPSLGIAGGVGCKERRASQRARPVSIFLLDRLNEAVLVSVLQQLEETQALLMYTASNSSIASSCVGAQEAHLGHLRHESILETS